MSAYRREHALKASRRPKNKILFCPGCQSRDISWKITLQKGVHHGVEASKNCTTYKCHNECCGRIWRKYDFISNRDPDLVSRGEKLVV